MGDSRLKRWPAGWSARAGRALAGLRVVPRTMTAIRRCRLMIVPMVGCSSAVTPDVNRRPSSTRSANAGYGQTPVGARTPRPHSTTSTRTVGPPSTWCGSPARRSGSSSSAAPSPGTKQRGSKRPWPTTAGRRASTGSGDVFVIDENGLSIAHPDPGRIGLDLKGWAGRDANGYNFGPDMLSATRNGKWVSYVYQNPESGRLGPDHAGGFELKNAWVGPPRRAAVRLRLVRQRRRVHQIPRRSRRPRVPLGRA